MYCSFFFHILLSRKKNHFAHIPELEIIIFFNFILFLNLKHCISFAKHQNESATGIHVLHILNPPPSFNFMAAVTICSDFGLILAVSNMTEILYESLTHQISLSMPPFYYYFLKIGI